MYFDTHCRYLLLLTLFFILLPLAFTVFMITIFYHYYYFTLFFATRHGYCFLLFIVTALHTPGFLAIFMF